MGLCKRDIFHHSNPRYFCLSGLWEDWQVYLPLSSQSSSLLNVCRPVGFRFRLQQKSFVMMKSQSFLSVFHFEGTEGLCGVVERYLLCSNGFDESVLLQWLSSVDVKPPCVLLWWLEVLLYMLNEHLWASEKALKINLFMFLQYTHQNTCMWNLKPYLWSVRYFRWGGSVCFVLFTEDLFLLQMDWFI